MPQPLPRIVSRRAVLAGLGGVALAAAMSPRGLLAGAAELPPAGGAAEGSQVLRTRPDARHLAWVWQFQSDGDPVTIRDTLAAHGLGVVVKTHDGTNWMGRYSKAGVAGPANVQALATFFDQAGVPFHAWAVVKGEEPLREAQMAGDVLGAGARSLFLDLESHSGFWQGTSIGAMRFGTELRRLRPNSWISTSVDPRPWELPRIPLHEFVSFTDEIAPQTYWNLFRSPANVRAYSSSGDTVPKEGVTAAFVVDSAMRHLRSYGRPIHPIGDGTPGTLSSWGEFINQSYLGEAETVSVWRYGVTDPAVWRFLKNTPPRSSSYLVQRGDTLPAIADRFNTTVPALTAANNLYTVDSVPDGMRLRVPATESGTAAMTMEVRGETASQRPAVSAGKPKPLVTPMPSVSTKAEALFRKR